MLVEEKEKDSRLGKMVIGVVLRFAIVDERCEVDESVRAGIAAGIEVF
jgi:hypothetical protein